MYQSINPTKGSELLRLRGEFSRAGFSVPPTARIRFQEDPAKLEKVIARYSTLIKPEGPYLPYLMVRNDGKPQGTGEGKSMPVAITDGLRRLYETIEEVRAASPDSAGVIIQPFVGQRMVGTNSEDGPKLYGPLLSGIAFTTSATERGNAILEWVFGHPTRAVLGGGSYAAFNRKTVESEWNDIGIRDMRTPAWFLSNYKGAIEEHEMRPEAFERIASDEKASLMLRMVMHSVLKLRDPLYLEWALTHIADRTRLFVFQAAEVEKKEQGFPTWMVKAFGRVDKLISLALPMPMGRDDAKRLKELHEAAVHDPNVVAAGFDVVGRKRLELSQALWLSEMRVLRRFNDCDAETPTLLVSSGPKRQYGPLRHYLSHAKVNGVVELTRSGWVRQTFSGHNRGFCKENNIAGLGEVEDMRHKLEPLLPRGVEHLDNALLRGKFVLEVDESIPFGTLRVEHINSVEEVSEPVY